MILALFPLLGILILLLGILSSLYKGRFKSYRKGILLFIGFIIIGSVIGLFIVSVADLMNSFYPDGFTDRIMSLSPDYYNTIGAPARTSPEYEEEQRYNIAILGNTSVISTNDKEVAEGSFKKRLLSLMTNKGK